MKQWLYKRSFQLIIFGLLMLLAFAFFSKYIKTGHFRSADFDTTVRLQDKIPSRLDEIMDDGGILADPLVSSAIVLIITGAGFINLKKKQIRPQYLLIPLAFFLLTVTEIYGKNFLPHPGPPFFMVKHPTTIFPKFTVMEPYSYPSGHAARATFVVVTFIFLIVARKQQGMKKKLIIVALLTGYAMFIYISRIYLGHHWLSDILGGVLLGSAFGILSGSFIYSSKSA